jgi:hypothetical protein
VRKRIISSLFSSWGEGGTLFSLLSWETDTRLDSEKKRVKEMRGREREGEREVSGEYASLFTGAPLFPIIRCD